MEFKDYYRILGVEQNADAATIKRKYRQLAKKFHPDTHPGDEEAEARFKEVSEAYDILGNSEKKTKYDQMLKYGFGSSSGGGMNFNPEDLSSLFGGQSGGFGDGFTDIFDLFTGRRSGMNRQRQPRVRRGEDIELEMSIGFVQSIKGGTLKLTVPQRTPCDVCDGRGIRPTVNPSHHEHCVKCKGEKFTRERKQVRVDVPAGVADGQRLTIQGEGHRGHGSAPAGQLRVTIRVKEDPRFRRLGKDLYTRLEIRLTEALTGTRLPVDTPTGSVTVTIPAGIQPGQKLKLKGEGVPDRNAPGDLFVEVQVKLPRKLSTEGQELLTRLERECEY